MLDQIWSSFLDFLTDKAGLYRFKPYQCMIKDNYGFEEFVQASPVAAQEEFKEFYFNFGFLLGAIYFLQGSDFHSENVIACGKYPVLIDLETIVRSGNITAFLDTVSSAKPFAQDSVMRTNLLPYLSPGKNYKAGYDALTVRLPGAKNLPYTPDGAYETGRAYAEDIICGFELCYRTLLDYGRDLFMEGGALDGIKTCSARFLIRDTGDYVKYLKLLSSRECMESESIFEKKISNLDKLYHSLSGGDGILPELSGFLEIEKESLRRGYIPKLTVRMDEELPDSENYKTCYDYLIHKHEFMNDADRENQILTIRRVTSNKTARDGSREVTESKFSTAEKDFAEELTDYMSRWLKRWTKLMEAGRVSGYIVEPEHNYYYYSVLEHPFSEGYLGLAPALAAWYKLTKSEDAKALLEQIAEKLEAILEAKPPSLFGDGLIDGLDGLCLFLHYTAEMTGLPGYKALLEIALDALIQRKVKVNYLNPSPLSLFYSLTASIYALSICNKGNEERINHKLYKLVSMQMEYVNHSLKEYRYGLMNGLDGFILAVSAAMRFLPDELNQKFEDFMKQAELLTEEADRTCGSYSVADGYAGHIIARRTGRSSLRRLDLRRPDLPCSDLPFVENTNFAFGSAGIIYALDVAGKQGPGAGYEEQSERYARRLLTMINKDGISHSLPAPEPIPSFQYGEGGIMYSLIHHLNPSAVDPIF
jgi:lantibiotic modifying enzyme